MSKILMVCTSAHDFCGWGCAYPCPHCDYAWPLRYADTGRFAPYLAIGIDTNHTIAPDLTVEPPF